MEYLFLFENNRNCNNIYKFVLKIIAFFGSNYIYEQLFILQIVKTNQKTRLTNT